ncbi:MAG: hypothetical protein VX029_02060, partial [Pseudomonadota bacterium]|nr:hypothetical protein [Pseudomonadota bacterium]
TAQEPVLLTRNDERLLSVTDLRSSRQCSGKEAAYNRKINELLRQGFPAGGPETRARSAGQNYGFDPHHVSWPDVRSIETNENGASAVEPNGAVIAQMQARVTSFAGPS